jgi:hypothetical protein
MEPDQVDIGRYLRFVVAFLLIMFSALGLYEYYYGIEARKAQELQEEFNRTNLPGASAAVTETP